MTPTITKVSENSKFYRPKSPSFEAILVTDTTTTDELLYWLISLGCNPKQNDKGEYLISTVDGTHNIAESGVYISFMYGHFRVIEQYAFEKLYEVDRTRIPVVLEHEGMKVRATQEVSCNKLAGK